jgi:transposase
MTKTRRRDPKRDALKRSNALHPHADKVTDALFHGSDFFDRRDLVQVKYEMLRRVRYEHASVVEAASAFGLSRPSFYEARAAFEQHGLRGLLPRKRGPRRAHKLAPPIVEFARRALDADPALHSKDLARRIAEQFKITVHPRSVERALDRAGKAVGTTSSTAPRRRP